MRSDQRNRPASGGRDGVGPIAQPEGEVLLAVDQPVEAEHSGRRRVSVGEPQRHRDLGADRCIGRRWRHRAVFSRSGTVARAHSAAAPRHRSGGPRRVVARRSGVPREAAVRDEARGPGIADEEGRDDQLQLVDEVVGQELGVHRPAALDHQPVHSAGAEVFAEPSHPDPPAAVDNGRDTSQPRACVGHARAHAVDELLGLAGDEEVGPRVQLHPFGHGDLNRRRWESISGPRVAARLRAHEQTRVVIADSRRSHQNRVARGAYSVDPIEVGVIGQFEAPRRRAAEIAVDRQRAAQQGVRKVRHVLLPFAATARSVFEAGYHVTMPRQAPRRRAGWRRAPARRRRRR